MSLDFRRTRTENLERLEAIDLNRTNNSAWNNLVFGLKNFVRPGNGVVWGCLLDAPGGLFVTLEKGAVMCEGGPVVFDTDQTLTIQPNGSGLDRIDLISVGFPSPEPTGTNEARVKWDDNLQAPFSTPMDTEILSSTTVTVTQGTPSITPSAPATPAGHVAIATVLVVDGASNISGSDISEVPGGRLHTIQMAAGANGVPQDVTLPWASETDPLPFSLTLNLDAGRTALLVAHIDVMPRDNQIAGLALYLKTLTPFETNLNKAWYPWVTKSGSGNDGGQTLFVVALATGIGQDVQYSLRLEQIDKIVAPNNAILLTSPFVKVSVGRMYSVAF